MGSAGCDERAGEPPILDDEYTILSTIHPAKGQEWKIVRVLNVIDGCIPSDLATATPEEIEEERRLLHVAMTRAKDELDLIVLQRFYTHNQSATGDRHVYASVSRFIPARIYRIFDRRAWREAGDDGQTAAPRRDRVVDVTMTVKKMWAQRAR